MDRCYSVLDVRIETTNFGSYGIKHYPYYWDNATQRFLYYVDDNNKAHIVSKESEE